MACALADQKTPYYNVERMISALAAKGTKIGVCGSCIEARGIKPALLAAGTHKSTMDELATWTQEADKALVFWVEC